jgi:hypothetical protein
MDRNWPFTLISSSKHIVKNENVRKMSAEFDCGLRLEARAAMGGAWALDLRSGR